MIERTTAASATLLLAAALLTGCGSDRTAAPTEATTGGTPIEVTAAFYPLQWMAEQVGGDRVDVASLTPPGAEPHDLELTPKQVAQVHDADLVVKLAGFQAAVDDAAGDAANVFEVADTVDLDLTTSEHDHDHEHGDEAAGDDHEAEGEHDHDETDHDETDHADHDGDQVVDPHFWLDPTMLAEVAPTLADRFAELDPDHAADFERRAAATVDLLDGIDEDFAAGLNDCASTDLVTSHQAFGYLARRYGLTQVGINGLSPEQEPSPARLAEVTDFVEEHDVETIYFETLVPSDIARTIAEETGARTAVLDPIEGVTEQSAGDDYPSIMAANLTALQQGQRCS